MRDSDGDNSERVKHGAQSEGKESVRALAVCPRRRMICPFAKRARMQPKQIMSSLQAACICISAENGWARGRRESDQASAEIYKCKRGRSKQAAGERTPYMQEERAARGRRQCLQRAPRAATGLFVIIFVKMPNQKQVRSNMPRCDQASDSTGHGMQCRGMCWKRFQ